MLHIHVRIVSMEVAKMTDKQRNLHQDASYKAQAIAMLASGSSQREVAKQLGVHQSTISRFAKKPDIKPLIEMAAQELIEQGLQPAVDLVIDTIRESHDRGIKHHDLNKEKNLLTLRKLALQSSEKVMKSAGVVPTHTQAPVIQNIVNVEGDAILSPNVKEILIAHTRMMTGNSDKKAEVES